MLSHVKGALLPFFSIEDANCLRLVCHEFLEDVTSHQWEDKSTVIRGSVAKWRRCFPRARAANVGEFPRSTQITDQDCVHFAGVLHLNIRLCTSITDKGFLHLQGIKSLNMGWCTQITDAAFVHLQGINFYEYHPIRQRR
jgi:hypothetical protein